MRVFHFDVVISGVDTQADDFEDQFYRAGCDDALISYQNGEARISFSREASSLDQAIMSAENNVMLAGARIVRIDRDTDPDRR